jgi:hypothetical protein
LLKFAVRMRVVGKSRSGRRFAARRRAGVTSGATALASAVELRELAMSYSPAIGRFLEQDPTGYDDGMNPYEFVGGNPVVKVDPTGLAEQPATQPTTSPADPVQVIVGPKLFQARYSGPGSVTFKQTVQITPCPCVSIPDAVREHEKVDHGGKDPFEGPVADNATGDPDKPYGGKGQRPNGGDRVSAKQMTDYPNFPEPYPATWCGKKSFVTTVVGEDGKVLKTVKWSVSRDSDGNVAYGQDN